MEQIKCEVSNDGYEALKKSRLEGLKQAGMIPPDAVLPPDHERVRPWDSLSPHEKKKESRKMELYAGMVENLDHNIGRLIQYLEDTGEFEKTVIVFMSDNGAAAEDFYYNAHYGPFLRQHFTDNYESMGKLNSFISYGPQWVEAGSAPFRYFKGETTEGGMVAPMIISGPGVMRKNEITQAFVTLMDIAPTFYQLAGVTYPANYNGARLYPLKGRSLIPLLEGSAERIHDSTYVFGLEHAGKVMLRRGDWKITNTRPPFDPKNIGLFDLRSDLAEINDLKEKNFNKYEELLEEWAKFSHEIGVRFPPPSSESE